MDRVADKISGPFVINLDHRTDRWKEIQAEFAKIGITPHRLSATYMPEDGASGCLKSHIRGLESAFAESPSCPIWMCEDDISFLVGGDALANYIQQFLDSSADVLCIGFANYKSIAYNELFLRTIDCQTTSSYIIKPRAVPDLIKLWNEVFACRMSGKKHLWEIMYTKMDIHHPDFYCADQCWKILQQRYTFLIPTIRCAYQRASYSDIERRFTNYRV